MQKTILMLPLLLLVSAAPLHKPDRSGHCVLRSLVAAPVVRDDGRVYFRGQPNPKQSYIAVFKGGHCPGLNRFSTVAIESTPSGYCEGDKVRPLNLPTTISGAVCIIDHLEPFAGDVDD